MAPSLATVKLFSSFAMTEISNNLTTRRGYAAVSKVGGSMSNSNMRAKSEEEKVSYENNWWIPDPLTGFCKPLDINNIFYVFFLRAKLLPKKFNKPSSRGYAAVSEVGGSMSNSKMQPKSEEEKVSNENNWWIPDPLTGFYKPLNINDIDAAELRAKLLPKKSNKPSSS